MDKYSVSIRMLDYKWKTIAKPYSHWRKIEIDRKVATYNQISMRL